jgi:hypothetical protein
MTDSIAIHIHTLPLIIFGREIPWWMIVIIIIILLIIEAIILKIWRDAGDDLEKTAAEEKVKVLEKVLSELKAKEQSRQNWERKEREQLTQLSTIIDDWFSREISIARTLRRSDLELKTYAEKNFKEVLSQEKEIISEYENKLQDPKLRALIKIPDSVSGQYSGELKKVMRFFTDFLLGWYEEKLKILYYARDYQARGGAHLEKLHEETYQKLIFDLRQKYLDEVQEREDAK